MLCAAAETGARVIQDAHKKLKKISDLRLILSFVVRRGMVILNSLIRKAVVISCSASWIKSIADLMDVLMNSNLI